MDSPQNSIKISTLETEYEYIEFSHIPALDGLRGIAVLMVMIYHLDFIFPSLHQFIKGGFLGVDIFFVLSGFLITSILIKEFEKTGGINLKNFFVRRFFRLVPAFWFFLIILYLLGNFILPLGEAEITLDPHNLFFAFTYLTNWYRATNDGFTGNLNHTWSLAIEEQFYIIWSILLFNFFKDGKTRKQIFIFTGGIICSVIIWRIFRVYIGTNTNILYYSTDTRIDALLIGCLGAMINSWNLLKINYESKTFDLLAFLSLLIALIILFLFSHSDIALYYGGLSTFSISIMISILWLVNRKSFLHKILQSNFLGWIGTLSYSLYLWHYAMYEFAKKTFTDIPIQIIMGILFSLLISVFSYYLVEKPFLRFKERFSN